jgi:hypothetical protein
MARFQPAADPYRTHVAGLANLPPLPDISYDKYDADFESAELSYLGGAVGNSPNILKQTELSLKRFAKRLGQPIFRAINKGKKRWVAGFLDVQYWWKIRRQKHSNQLLDGPLHWEMVVADLLVTFTTWPALEIFNNAEWIWQRWVKWLLRNAQVRFARPETRNRQATRDRWQI